MTKKQGNVLIDVFLNGRELMSDKKYIGRKRGSSKKYENWYDITEVSDLDYDSSFDSLMPVVEKIGLIDITPAPNYEGYRIEILVRGYVKITGRGMPQIFTNVSIEGSLIAAVWKAVVTFIEYYNTTVTKPLEK